MGKKTLSGYFHIVDDGEPNSILEYLPPFLKLVHKYRIQSFTSDFVYENHITGEKIELSKEKCFWLIGYLIDEGFCEEKRDYGEGYFQLTEKGRRLKDLGTIQKFYEWEYLERSEARFRTRMAENSYWMTVAIALSTGMAAVYYFYQLCDGQPREHKAVAQLTLGICIGIVMLLVLIRYLPRFLKKR